MCPLWFLFIDSYWSSGLQLFTYLLLMQTLEKKTGIPTLNIHGKGWLLTAVNIVVIKEHFEVMFSKAEYLGHLSLKEMASGKKKRFVL